MTQLIHVNLIILTDVEYSIDNPSSLDDISVIDFGGRFRRQADNPTVTDHTEEATTPKNPSVVDDTLPDFGQRLFPEEYDVKHASCFCCTVYMRVIPLVLPMLTTKSVVYHTCKNLLLMSPLSAAIVLVDSQITSIIG